MSVLLERHWRRSAAVADCFSCNFFLPLRLGANILLSFHKTCFSSVSPDQVSGGDALGLLNPPASN